MHIEIRIFPGMAGQGGRLTARRSELMQVVADMRELHAFELAETREGLALVVVCASPAEATECCRRFAVWSATRMPDLEWRGAFAVGGSVITRLER